MRALGENKVFTVIPTAVMLSPRRAVSMRDLMRCHCYSSAAHQTPSVFGTSHPYPKLPPPVRTIANGPHRDSLIPSPLNLPVHIRSPTWRERATFQQTRFRQRTILSIPLSAIFWQTTHPRPSGNSQYWGRCHQRVNRVEMLIKSRPADGTDAGCERNFEKIQNN